MGCLSKTLIDDVSLTIGEQLQYIGFRPYRIGARVKTAVPGCYYKTVCGVTLNVRLRHVKIGGAYGHRISLDWRDVKNNHLSELIFGEPTLENIDATIRKLSDGVLNIYIERDKDLDEYEPL